MTVAIRLHQLRKTFVLHNQGGARLPVLAGVTAEARFGRCLVLHGPSGSGKSTLLRTLYGNYKPDAGYVEIAHDGGHIRLPDDNTRAIIRARRQTLAYVSQFLRVIPRVSSLDVVAEPLIEQGQPRAVALERAARLLDTLAVPERLWHLPPGTFSGGEQQRINIARGFVAEKPIILLDEPTASLDAANAERVVGLIETAKQGGACIVGIFHDRTIRERVADDVLALSPVTAATSFACGEPA
ncbi:MAG: phosphonate C-P lyase system protein PhnL [Gammaproteobacteria bacterium]|nr:phosphonate C-P lyase system protein PhnL [Gammaproteobacteria bacterium]